MTRRLQLACGLLMALGMTGCVTHRHYGQTVVYRTPPAQDYGHHEHYGDDRYTSPGTYGDDDDDHDGRHGRQDDRDYAETAAPPWYDRSDRTGSDDGRAVPPGAPSETAQGKPPAHAPAHGLRRKYVYYYYPTCEVYYSPQREMYFWIEGKNWVFGAKLPQRLHLNEKEAVHLRLLAEHPYDLHEQVVKQHGPKKGKGGAKGNGSDKGQGAGSDKGAGKGDGKVKQDDDDESDDGPSHGNGKGKANGKDKDKGDGKGKQDDDDESDDGPSHGNGKVKGKDKDKDKGDGKGKG